MLTDDLIHKATRLSAAYQAGKAYMKGLRQGQEFWGLFPAAEAQGFADTAERSMFTHGGREVIGDRLICIDHRSRFVGYYGKA